MVKEIPAGHVEVRWSYRPDDRSKQGTKEFLPRDLARTKVGEGLATYVPVVAEAVVEDEAPKTAKKTTPARPES